LDLTWVIVLSAVAWWQMRTTFGPSPQNWEDTLHEDMSVADCLDNNRCTTVGPGSTIGIFHSAGYLHWRELLSWLGLGLDGTFGTLLVFDGIGVGLTALAARRLGGGRLGAALAALIMVPYLGGTLQMHLVSDVAPVAFLGALFLIVCVTAAFRDSLLHTAVLGMVTGVIVDVYASTLCFAVTIVVLALLQPHRRWKHVVTTGGAFVAVAFAAAPGTWMLDLVALLRGGVGSARPLGRSLQEVELFRASCVASLLCLASMAVSGLRKSMAVPAAIILPLFPPLAYGVVTGALDPQDKYFAHVVAAVAVGIALPAVAAARWLGGRAVRLNGWTWSAAPAAAAIWLAPYAAAGAIGAGWTRIKYESDTSFTYDDLATAQRALVARGWDKTAAARNLEMPNQADKRAALSWVTDWPRNGKVSPFEHALLLAVPNEPLPLPSSMTELAHTRTKRVVLGFTCSWIDWSAFQACVMHAGTTEEVCSQIGIKSGDDIGPETLPGMPRPAMTNLQQPWTLRLRLPLAPQDACPEWTVRLPPMGCRGHIVSVGGEAQDITDDGLVARVSRARWPPGKAPGDLVIQWDVQSPECQVGYRGYPPFFFEGDPQMVEALSRYVQWAQ
jgi:hypothetical protein